MDSTNTDLNRDHPWPGLKAFTEDNAAYFFGRRQEIEDLSRIVRQETLTVLYGKSGLGKTSILRAGVSPMLRKSGFLPVYIRLNHYEETLPLEDQVEVFIEKAIASDGIEAPYPIREETLWEYFHKKNNDWWDQDNQLLKPVLIFDQFEEILTVGQENPVRTSRCLSFLTELEDLIENRPPATLRERFRAEKGLAKNYDLDRIDYRVILSLREDYLVDLEGLREKLRSIMLNRFRLLPMTAEQAMSVILEPGGHLIDTDVAFQVIDFISSAQKISPIGIQNPFFRIQQIEPTLLSVILQELNNHRIHANNDKITSELLLQYRPEDILSEFYESGLKGLDSNIRRFIEKHFITASGARNRIAEEDAIERHGISRNAISTLINRRIIQRDKIDEITWLELSHDALTPVVQRHAESYRRQQRFRKAMLRIGAVIVVVVGLGASAYLYQSFEQELQTRKAATLAVDIATELENTGNMSITSKQYLIDRLEESFDELKGYAKNSDFLQQQEALFLAKSAIIQFEQGYFERATKSTVAAKKLLFAKNSLKEENSEPTLIKIQVMLLEAEAMFYRADYVKAHQSLDQAKQLIDFYNPIDDVDKTSLTLLAQRLSRIRIQTFYSENKIDDFLKLLASAQNQIRTLLTRTALTKYPEIKRGLYTELFNLNILDRNLASQLKISNSKEVYMRFRSDLEQALPFFQNNNDQHWRFYNALSHQIKADMHEDANEINEVRASYNIAVNILSGLVQKNQDNLLYRFHLGRILLSRAQFSEERDSLQAKFDLKTARSLSLTLRRDTPHPYLPLTLALRADSVQLRLERFAKERNAFDTAFARLMARIDAYRSQFTRHNDLDDRIILAYYWKISELKDNTNLETITEALSMVEQILSLLDELGANGADSAYLSIQRYWIYQAALFLTTNNSEVNDKLISYSYAAEEQFDNLNNSALISVKTWLLAQRGNLYSQSDRHKEAIGTYKNLVQFGLQQAKLYPDNKSNIINTIYGITRLIKLQNILSDWPGVIESAELLFSVFDPETGKQSVTYPEDILRFWKDSHDALKAAKKAMEEVLASNGLSDENENHSISLDTPNSELYLSQKQLNNILELSSKAMEELSAMTVSNNSGDYSLSTYFPDLKSLDISAPSRRDNDNRQSNIPFGWQATPIYSAPWSYTLENEQVQPYSKRLNAQVLRIRYTQLPFYSSGKLLTIESLDKEDRLRTSYFLESEQTDKLLELDGTSPPIHEANAIFPVQLNTIDEVAAYLRFFTTFVHGDEGSFLLVESIDEIPWSQEVPAEEKIRAASNLIRPVFIWREENTDNWYATATVNYSNALFHAKFKIENTGKIDMLGDRPVAANLPLDIFKIARNSGRFNHFVENLYLEIIQAINIENVDDEVNQLLALLEETSKMNEAHSISIAEELISLAQVTSSATFKFYETIHSIFERLPDVPSRITAKAHQIILEIVTQQKNKITELAQHKKSNIHKLPGEYVSLSFYQLFAGDFQGALTSSQKGLELDSNYLPLYTNYAHALLFLGYENEATAVYREHKGKIIKNTGKTWNEIIINDFNRLERAGISHPEMKQIRKELQVI
ncbi:MAG: hypothetical protein MRK00_01580 [Nitrosomonas sp.]|nr:hypothetical protein [Nitrosomonas sp.]